MEGGREGGGTANHHLDVYFNFTVFGWHLKTQSCVSVTCSLNTPVGEKRSGKSDLGATGRDIFNNFYGFITINSKLPHTRTDKQTRESADGDRNTLRSEMRRREGTVHSADPRWNYRISLLTSRASCCQSRLM